jgi:hypothetical protein
LDKTWDSSHQPFPAIESLTFRRLLRELLGTICSGLAAEFKVGQLGMRVMQKHAVLITLLAALDGGCDSEPESLRDVTARPFDESRMCLGDFQVVGSIENDIGCRPATTFAIDRMGRCFWFRDLCLPDGFSRVMDSDSKCPPSGALLPDCPPQVTALPNPALRPDGQVGRCAPSPGRS